MKKLILILIILVMSISVMAKLNSGWIPLNNVSSQDSFIGAVDTVSVWLNVRKYESYLDDYITFGFWYYGQAVADTATVEINAHSWINGAESKSCQYATGWQDDSVMHWNILPDSVALFIMHSDSIKFELITAGQAADTSFPTFYLGYATFNQVRW